MRKFEKIGNEDAMNTLARMAVNIKYEDIPAEVADFAKVLILDTIGCMIGGNDVHPIPTLVKHYQKKGGIEEAYIPFFGGKIPAEDAAMVMGPMTRAIDFAPIHPDAMHQTEHVLPPMLASLGLLDKVTGKDFITAFVAGIETMLRIGIGFNCNKAISIGRSNGHYIFGGVAAVGHLLGFNQETMENAFGIARQMTQPHDMAAFHPVTHMIKVHQGFIAQDVITCCKFAQLGITGPRVDVLEGPKGLLGMAAWEIFPEKITDNLGEYWHFMEIEMKAYCGCKCLHMACYGVLDILKTNNIKIEDIEKIHVEECKLNAGVSGGTIEEKMNPKDTYERQFSIPYMVATMVFDGDLMPNSFLDDAAARPYIKDFMQKVSMGEDFDLPEWYSKVYLTTKAGKTYEEIVGPEKLKGSVTNRYTREELIEKVKKCEPYSSMKMDEALLDRISENVLSLEKSTDVLTDVVVPLVPKS